MLRLGYASWQALMPHSISREPEYALLVFAYTFRRPPEAFSYIALVATILTVRVAIGHERFPATSTLHRVIGVADTAFWMRSPPFSSTRITAEFALSPGFTLIQGRTAAQTLVRFCWFRHDAVRISIEAMSLAVISDGISTQPHHPRGSPITLPIQTRLPNLHHLFFRHLTFSSPR
jgi:hypothetical protein